VKQDELVKALLDLRVGLGELQASIADVDSACQHLVKLVLLEEQNGNKEVDSQSNEE